MKSTKFLLTASLMLVAATVLADPLHINLVSYSGAGSTRNVTLSVTNTSTNFLYGVYRRTEVTGSETLVTNFIGNNGTATIVDTVPVSDQAHFYRARQEPGFIVWRTPGAAVGTSGSCPGHYIGYANYLSPDLDAPALGWWFPDTNNFPVSTVTDPFRTDTKIVWLTTFGASGCGATTVSLNGPWGRNPTNDIGDRVRFSVYFNANLPTGPYPMRFIGWLPVPDGGADPLPLAAMGQQNPAVMSSYVASPAEVVARPTLTPEQIAARKAAVAAATQKMVDMLNMATEQAQAAAAARAAAKAAVK